MGVTTWQRMVSDGVAGPGRGNNQKEGFSVPAGTALGHGELNATRQRVAALEAPAPEGTECELRGGV